MWAAFVRFTTQSATTNWKRIAFLLIVSPFFTALQFMVTLQMSIILWPSCCCLFSDLPLPSQRERFSCIPPFCYIWCVCMSICLDCLLSTWEKWKQLSIEARAQYIKHTERFMMNGNMPRWCENYIRCCILWKLVNICIGWAKHVQYAIVGLQFIGMRVYVYRKDELKWQSNCKLWKMTVFMCMCKVSTHSARIDAWSQQLNKLDNFHVQIDDDHRCTVHLSLSLFYW